MAASEAPVSISAMQSNKPMMAKHNKPERCHYCCLASDGETGFRGMAVQHKPPRIGCGSTWVVALGDKLEMEKRDRHVAASTVPR